jgi:hypothetical protein
MKFLFTTIGLACCLVASAQKNERKDIHQSIHDDGKTMQVDVTGNANGRDINYHRTFNISQLSAQEKKALTRRIADSLGIESNEPPVPPAPPRVNVNAPPAPPAPPAVGVNSRSNSHSSIHDDGKTMSISINSFNGTKSVNYQKSFRIDGMSARQKQALVKRITDSLGVSNNVVYNAN